MLSKIRIVLFVGVIGTVVYETLGLQVLDISPMVRIVWTRRAFVYGIRHYIAQTRLEERIC